MKNKRYDGIGIMKTCPICGKEFMIKSLEMWTYKLGYGSSRPRYYRSYTCYRKDGN